MKVSLIAAIGTSSMLEKAYPDGYQNEYSRGLVTYSSRLTRCKDRIVTYKRGPKSITAAPIRQMLAPVISQRSGRTFSMLHSQNSEATM